MTNEWNPVNFEVLPYKSTGTFIIKASDDVAQMLDDHIVMTQTMTFSPYKKPFEDRISSWEQKLRITQVSDTPSQSIYQLIKMCIADLKIFTKKRFWSGSANLALHPPTE